MVKRNMKREEKVGSNGITRKEITVKDSGFKVGDILVGQSHMYHTVTYWFEIVKVTEKRLRLKELPIAYPTAYRSNTPGDECMPILKVKGHWYLPLSYPYTDPLRDYDEVVARIVEYDWSYPKGKKDVFAMTMDGRHMLLSLWDGKEGWVNCD